MLKHHFLQLCLTILLVLLPAAGHAGAPHEIAGFVLGAPLEKFKDRVDMSTVLPLRYTKYLEEVETRNIPGFKNGLIWFGRCQSPNRIVRIRMKYADPSKKFYDQLLKHYKQRFGEPSEWRGDPFHIVISWKWSFVDEQNNRISMILEYNRRDEEEAIGNTVKLTMWNLIEEERNCAKQKASGPSVEAAPEKAGPPEWEFLIPR